MPSWVSVKTEYKWLLEFLQKVFLLCDLSSYFSSKLSVRIFILAYLCTGSSSHSHPFEFGLPNFVLWVSNQRPSNVYSLNNLSISHLRYQPYMMFQTCCYIGAVRLVWVYNGLLILLKLVILLCSASQSYFSRVHFIKH